MAFNTQRVYLAGVLMLSALILTLAPAVLAQDSIDEDPAVLESTEPVAETDAQPELEAAEQADPEEDAPAEEPAQEEETPAAGSVNNVLKIQVLNKITAINTNLRIPAGSEEVFSQIVIRAIDCWKAPPEERPEAAGLMEVWEQANNKPRERKFYGWMFASTPGLSALEHPIYDIVMLDCIEGKP